MIFSDLCITNARIVTMQTGIAPLDNHAIIFNQGRIVWIGPSEDPTRPAFNTIFDAQGMLLTPGLIDCHTHLVYADPNHVRVHEFEKKTQGMAYKDIALQGGGIRATMRATREASEELLLETASRDLNELSSHGVTTLEIKASYAGDLEGTLKELRVIQKLKEIFPITIQTTWCPQIVPPEFSSEDYYVNEIINKILPRISIDAIDAFCEQTGVGLSPVAVKRIFQRAKELGILLKCHVDQLSNQEGAALVASMGAISADHLEYTSEEGIRSMASAGTTAVLLPGAFYYQREKQKPPMELLRKYGIPMAVATDCNPGSSPITSPLFAMNLACICFGLSTEEAFSGMTREGARALGMHHERGVLDVGMAADCVLWDAESISEIIYRCSRNACVGVWKSGIRSI